MNALVRGRRRAGLCAILLLCGIAAAGAQLFVTTGRDTLRGLPGVEVVVDELPPALTRTGITTASLRDVIVERLAAHEIAVYESQDANTSPAKPYLYVLVTLLELPDRGGHAAGIQVHLRQTLRSPVTGSNVVNAMTWEAHNVLAVPPGSLPALRQEVLDYVDLFVDDWRTVHP